ncbi:GNAT family protein [Babesia ovis]|uniref:N-alpha-acetyltransferase 40 n=1 Tax=Babesia ovis TaxID=5869 RepID=A0A9W5WU22_BABOV|nr:GNAT family protein [Babesia ovis]
MSRKRPCNTLRKLWYPDSIARSFAEAVCAAFNGSEIPPEQSDVVDCLQLKLEDGHSLKHYMGNVAPKDVLDSLFNLTKENMSGLYNESGFLGGWRDQMKYRELSAAKTHILELRDDTGMLVGFVSYRFLIISDWQPATKVCYIYELQVDAKRRSRGVGKFLVKATEIIGRKAEAKKLMCTVLKLNRRAVAFYRNKCGFTDDESDPSSVDFENRDQHIYHILKLDIGDTCVSTPGTDTDTRNNVDALPTKMIDNNSM